MKLIKLASAVLNQTPLDWEGNKARITAAIEAGKAEKASILCLPELCITGYGCEDAFHSPALQQTAIDVLHEILPATQGIIVSLGLPLLYHQGLFNTACLACDGSAILLTQPDSDEVAIASQCGAFGGLAVGDPAILRRLPVRTEPSESEPCVLGRETIQILGQSREAMIVQLDVPDSRQRSGRNVLRFYVSDDPERLVLRIDSSMPVAGALTLTLTEVRQ